jgi:tRNA (uracil-5-)-methyltransferase
MTHAIKPCRLGLPRYKANMDRNEVHPANYARQLAEKTTRLKRMLSEFGMPDLEVFESPPEHYRMRSEFRVWHDDDDLYYIMFDADTKEPYRVDQFVPASRLINEVMTALIDAIKNKPTLRRKLFQVDFLSTLSDEIVVSLLYHRKLDEEWKQQAKALRQDLRDLGFKLDLIGRARKMKIELDRDYVIERLKVHDTEYIQQQCENSFTQPNAHVAQWMLGWAIDCTRGSEGDLLELYCGNGNFSLALAQNFNRVLATEVAKSSVRSAQYNIEANGIENLKVVRLSAKEVVEALDHVREFRRLQNAEVDLKTYDFRTVFVDPPRAGMDEESCATVQRFDRILYISCNPDTLKDNLELLCKTHAVTRFALFDQFPYTKHVETGVLLQRR